MHSLRSEEVPSPDQVLVIHLNRVVRQRLLRPALAASRAVSSDLSQGISPPQEAPIQEPLQQSKRLGFTEGARNSNTGQVLQSLNQEY